MSTLALASIAHVGGPWGAGFGILFFLIPLFWIALFLTIVFVAGRRFRRGFAGGGPYGPWNHGARSAESTLAERFAQGDIDEKEYRARLEVLRANNPSPFPKK